VEAIVKRPNGWILSRSLAPVMRGDPGNLKQFLERPDFSAGDKSPSNDGS